MANCYFILMDTTKRREHPDQMWFFKQPFLNDIADFIERMAIHNGSPSDAIRLFVAPDKKTWTAMSLDFQKRVDWSLVK